MRSRFWIMLAAGLLATTWTICNALAADPAVQERSSTRTLSTEEIDLRLE